MAHIFTVGQQVCVVSTALTGRTGTVLEVRQRDGVAWYQVGGRLADESAEIWNADFQADELAHATVSQGIESVTSSTAP
jgi:hypothetical protein